MKFFTEVKISPAGKKIEHENSVFTIGSCFAENIGKYFSNLKFDISVNPFGVLYNPASIKNVLKLVRQQKIFKKEDLVYDKGEWHSLYHHSDFSDHKPETVISNINAASASVYNFLNKVDWFIISLGTSIAYKHIESSSIVSNCHKIPQKYFTKEFLSPDENFENIRSILELQKSFNPNTKFILTVSPIRHIKDGVHQNQLSKASLLLAANRAEKEFDNVIYFPSYEIVMDELRDYRYFGKDLIHPNEIAIEYIWEKFSNNLLSADCIDLITKIDQISKAVNHKIRNKNSSESKRFVDSQIKMIEELLEKYPYLDFSNELTHFKNISEE